MDKYYLYKNKYMGYCVVCKCGQFSQQVTRWYIYKGRALKALDRILAHERGTTHGNK